MRKRSLGVVVLLGATVIVGSGSTPARADGFFDAVAAAQGVETSSTPGYEALGDTVDGGGFVAQAELNALGTSTAYASQPYPGAVAAGEAGANYPLFVSSSYPVTPMASNTTPASNVQATSSATSSDAVASNGMTNSTSGTTGATSTADVTAGSDGTLTSTADADVEGFSVAGVLSISGVHSHASFTTTSSGSVQHTATIEITGASVMGTPVTIGSDGVTAAGSTTALPISADAANAALAAMGITVAEVEGTQDNTQATAPALRISVAQNVPQVGPVTTNYYVGYARAAISGSDSPDASTSTDTTYSSPVDTTSKASSSPSAAPASVKPKPNTPPKTIPTVAASSVSSQPASVSAPPPTSSGTAAIAPVAALPSTSPPAPLATSPTAAAATPVSAAQAPTASVASLRRLKPYSWIALYVIAIAAAMLALGGGLLIRNLGVNAR